ncbi:hypothetical protein RR46_03475 [Papilio xuthus]|uniref:Uncharacterized protein n=1 Tax=Papilio xuthus TaxID=66420 RepID=A0A194QB31_PAPXU|nr:hypothetical protein RR46_03475 [Papilio xuthus]
MKFHAHIAHLSRAGASEGAAATSAPRAIDRRCAGAAVHCRLSKNLTTRVADASSSNEAVHLQRRLLSLSSELVTLRNHLHVGGAGAAGPSVGATGSASGSAQPAVPPRAPLLPPPSAPAPPPPAPPAAAPHAPVAPHPSLQPPPVPPPETRWRGGAGAGAGAGHGAGQGAAADDLIHLRGPLTEDAVVRALQASSIWL